MLHRFVRSSRSFLVFLATVCNAVLCGQTIAKDSPVRFNRDVRGILTDKCFACHGPDAETVEGDLRLDQRDSAVGHAITPGNLSESELVARIRSTDPETVMPPPETNKPLSDEERKILEQWILEGAEYEAHWAYTSLDRPEPPGPATDRGRTARRAPREPGARPTVGGEIGI